MNETDDDEEKPTMIPSASTALHVVSALLKGVVVEVQCYKQNVGDDFVWGLAPHFQLSVIRAAAGLLDYAADELALASNGKPPPPQANFAQRLNNAINLLNLSRNQTKDVRNRLKNMVALRDWASHPRSRLQPHEQQGKSFIHYNFHPEKLSYAQIYAYANEMFEIANALKTIWPKDDSTWAALDIEWQHLSNFRPEIEEPFPTSKEELENIGLNALKIEATLCVSPVLK